MSDVLTKDEADDVAVRPGQILKETAPQHGLFSEDVW